MINFKIEKGEWYKVKLDDNQEYVGKCIEEPFLDNNTRKQILRMSVYSKTGFSDFSIPTEIIIAIRLLETKKNIGDKIYKINHDSNNGVAKFYVVCFNKSDADIIDKELISNKKTIGTFEDIEKVVEFLEKLI
jgi:hypothetical protein